MTKRTKPLKGTYTQFTANMLNKGRLNALSLITGKDITLTTSIQHTLLNLASGVREQKEQHG